MTDQLTDVERLMVHTQGFIPRLLFVVAGPSGVGKNTIIKELLTNHPLQMSRLITYTTRPRRDDEVEGEQYRFVSPERFRALGSQGKLLEVDEHTVGHDVYKMGHVYSMPKDIYEGIPRTKHLVLAEVDIFGMRLLREHHPECVTIFVTAPPEVLLDRIRERRDDHMDEANLAHRMQTAREQIAAAKEFDYVVFNEDGRLYHAVKTIEAIIQVERMRIREGFDLLSAAPEALIEAAQNNS